MVRRIKTNSKIKTIPTKISVGLRKDLDKIIIEYKTLGIALSYGEAGEIYRKTK